MPIPESNANPRTTQEVVLVTAWCKRGSVLGLVFSLVCACGVRFLGLPWIPHGVGLIIAGAATGFLTALVWNLLLPRTGTSANPPSPKVESAVRPGETKTRPAVARMVQRRLAEEKACLEQIDGERELRGDSGFGRTVEERIVWGELLELELQDIDEQVNRIVGTAGRAPRTSADSHPRKRNDA